MAFSSFLNGLQSDEENTNTENKNENVSDDSKQPQRHSMSQTNIRGQSSELSDIPQIYQTNLYLYDPSKRETIGIYKNMPINELKNIICAAFTLPVFDVNIVGLQDQNRQIIPLSYLVQNPSYIQGNKRYKVIYQTPRQQNGARRSNMFWFWNCRQWFNFFDKHWNTIFQWIIIVAFIAIVYNFYESLVTHWYFNGPHIRIPIVGYDIGGWSGMEKSQICSKLTPFEGKFWSSDQSKVNECERILLLKLTGYMTTFETISIGIVIYHILTSLMQALRS